MNTVLNLLSAAAVVITGTVASTAPSSTASVTHNSVTSSSAQVTTPIYQPQPIANSAARTAAYLPSVNSVIERDAEQVDLNRGVNQRWVF